MIRLRLGWALALAPLVLTPAPTLGQFAPPDSTVLRALEAYVIAEQERWQIPGLSVAVAHRGEIAFRMDLGLADVELGVPVTEASVFEIGSISKPFVSTVVLQLRDEGRLSLDDPIHAFLPGLPSAWRGVTLRHLLTHTSGIPDYEEVMGYTAYRNRMTLDDVVRLAHSEPPRARPGECFDYSNTGYVLLSHVIERIEGRALADVLDDRIFVPAGMRTASLSGADPIVPGRVRGYARDRAHRLHNRDASQVSATLGAGGILATLDDLVRWDAALYTDDLLPAATKREAWTGAILIDGTESEYGMGWRVEPYEGHAEQYHYGMTPGFVANLTRLPDDEVAVIVLGNRFEARINRIVVALLHAFVPSLGPSRLEGAPR